MPAVPRAPVLRFIRDLTERDRVLHRTDAELLQSFLTQRDERAFATLVRRHGAMVLRVCHHVLLNTHDAEDAFQATFLVLSRKAAAVQKQHSVGSWLFGVARRVALRLKRTRGRQRVRDSRVPERKTADPLAEVSVREAEAILYEELNRLADRHRAPLVLCTLEGLTRDEAARHLGWPLARLKNCLEQARKRLRGRLAARGLGLSGAWIGAALCEHTLPAALPSVLVHSTVSVAASLATGAALKSVASAQVAALTEGVMTAMLLTRLNMAAGVLLLIGILTAGLGAGLASHGVQAAATAREPTAPRANTFAAQPAQPRPAKEQTVKLDEPVQRARWSRDGSLVASFSGRVQEKDGKKSSLCTFRIWDGATGQLKHSLGEIENPGVHWFGFSPDGKRLAISSRRRIELGDQIELYDVSVGRLVKTIELEYARSRVWLAFSHDGGTIAVCGSVFTDNKLQGETRLVNADTGKVKRRLVGGSETISVAFSADGKWLATGGHLGDIAIWDLANGKIDKTLATTEAIAALAFSPDSRQIASGGPAPVRLWDWRKGESRELQGSDGPALAAELTFSNDGRFLAGEGSAKKDGKRFTGVVYLWDARTAALVRAWPDTLRGFGFSADSKRLGILHDPRTIRIWGITGTPHNP